MVTKIKIKKKLNTFIKKKKILNFYNFANTIF